MLELTEHSFDNEVIRAKTPVIVDFWAPWCGPCVMLAPTFEAISKEYPKVKFAKLNTQDHPETASLHSIMSIPCIVVFHNGKEIDRIIGAYPKESLRRKIDTALIKTQ